MHETWREGGFRKISPFFILQTAPNILAGQLAILLNCRGPNMSIASACATSGHTLGESARAIQRGDADVILAGGAEAVITQVAVGAFAQMKALSTRNDAPEKASRPYDADRDGFVIGEGAVVFVLEETGARDAARGPDLRRAPGLRRDGGRLPPLVACARGRGLPPVDAAGARRLAASRRTRSAMSRPTPPRRRAATARRRRRSPRCLPGARDRLHVSAVKSMTGHLLGAAGALGALAAVLAIDRGVIPPTINLENLDPACAALGLDFTPRTARSRSGSTLRSRTALASGAPTPRSSSAGPEGGATRLEAVGRGRGGRGRRARSGTGYGWTMTVEAFSGAR